MDTLPNELILELLVKMSNVDILNSIKTNKKIKEIFDKNKDVIYKRKIQNEFACIETEEDIYMMLYNSAKEYEELCIEKSIKFTKDDCEDILFNLIKINKISNANRKTKVLIRLLTKIEECYNYLINKVPNFEDSIIKTFERVNNQIILSKRINDEIKKKWIESYKNFTEKVFN